MNKSEWFPNKKKGISFLAVITLTCGGRRTVNYSLLFALYIAKQLWIPYDKTSSICVYDFLSAIIKPLLKLYATLFRQSWNWILGQSLYSLNRMLTFPRQFYVFTELSQNKFTEDNLKHKEFYRSYCWIKIWLAHLMEKKHAKFPWFTFDCAKNQR